MRRVFPSLCAVILIALVCLTGCAGEAADAASPVDTVAVSVTATPSPEPTAVPVLIDVTLYLPNADLTGLTTVSAAAEDSPRGLLSALVDSGALPDVDYGATITFGLAEETISTDDGEISGTILRLDLSDAFAQAVRQSGAQTQALYIQSLANTFLTRYDADAMVLTIEGTVLETAYEKYEDPITFDEFASTETD